MFTFKKVVSVFFFPVAVLGLLLGTGVALLWQNGRPVRKRWGRRLITGAAVLFWVLGSNWCGDLALWPLIRQYPAPDMAAWRAERGAEWVPDAIVVLAAGHYPFRELPPSLRLSDRSLARVNMAFRLHREFPQTPIICTGGKLYEDFEPISRDMAAALREWGVSADLLSTEEEARDTDDHVRYLRAILQGKTFLLVTSATHMPRSMALFRRAGLTPIAAPEPDADLSVRKAKDWWRGLVPNGGNFARVEAAAYEYLGLMWAKLQGLI